MTKIIITITGTDNRGNQISYEVYAPKCESLIEAKKVIDESGYLAICEENGVMGAKAQYAWVESN